jgi:hypothetical protein
MTKPIASELTDTMNRVFPVGTDKTVSTAEVISNKKLTPIWKYFAWLLIILLLVEPAVANRLKR